jgi:hypothetical protein
MSIEGFSVTADMSFEEMAQEITEASQNAIRAGNWAAAKTILRQGAEVVAACFPDDERAHKMVEAYETLLGATDE